VLLLRSDLHRHLSECLQRRTDGTGESRATLSAHLKFTRTNLRGFTKSLRLHALRFSNEPRE
jgi:hypothetical protein